MSASATTTRQGSPLRTWLHHLRQAREVMTFRRAVHLAALTSIGAWSLILLGPATLERGFGVDYRFATLTVLAMLALASAVARAAAGPWGVPKQPYVAANIAATGLYISTLIAPVWLAMLLWLVAAVSIGQAVGLAFRLSTRTLPSHLRPAGHSWLCVSMALAVLPVLLSWWQLSLTGARVALAGLAVMVGWGALAIWRLEADRIDDEARARAREDAAEPTDDAPVLVARDLEVSYGPVQVLFGVDLEVHAGEIVGLLGTNGAGKSTVLKTVAGHLRPTRGTVHLDGEDATGLLPEELASMGLSMVPGGRAVFQDLTVEENLRMGAFLVTDTTKIRQTTERIWDLFPQLAERRNMPAGALSGGEQQMLAIAQALYTEPSVLMIDELSLGLAPSVVSELLDVVRVLAAEGVAIVLVEQSVNVALSVTDRALFLEKGAVRFEGKAAELLERPDILRSVFLEGVDAAIQEVAA